MYDNLIALRKSLGLDQKEFAESVGYKRKHPQKAKSPHQGAYFIIKA